MTQTYHMPISTSDALSLSYRRLAVPKIIRTFLESCLVGVVQINFQPQEQLKLVSAPFYLHVNAIIL